MRHHYVPQFMLRAWAETTADGKIEIFRLDLNGLPSSRRGPKYTGYEDDLYALSRSIVAGMEKQAVERHFLRHLDGRGALVRAKMDKSGLRGLSSEERGDWSYFLMSLRIRVPEIVIGLRQDAASHLKDTLNAQPDEYEEIVGADDPPTLAQWTERQFPGLIENFGLSFFHELVTNPEIGEKIFRMRWWLWDFSRRGHKLLLSDRPCILTSSLKDEDCILALPISPTKAFMATRSYRVAETMRAQDPRHLAMRLNESSLAQAKIRIYGRDRSSERFIRNRHQGARCVVASAS